MEPTSSTIKVLEEIRDSVRDLGESLNTRIDQTNSRLDQTNSRLDQTNSRLDQTNSRLESLADRVVEAEIRTATNVMQLGGTLAEVRELLRDHLGLGTRVERCEQDIAWLKGRTGPK